MICVQSGLAAQLMAITWLTVVPITNDNVIVISNITFQANKANQFIIFSFIISIFFFLRHINCLIATRDALECAKCYCALVAPTQPLDLKWSIHGYQATTSNWQLWIASSSQRGPKFASTTVLHHLK